MESLPRGKLLRKAGRPVFRVIAYESSRYGLIVPKGNVFELPKTATGVLGTFFSAKTRMPIVQEALALPAGSPRRNVLIKSSQVFLKPETVRKMVLG